MKPTTKRKRKTKRKERIIDKREEVENIDKINVTFSRR